MTRNIGPTTISPEMIGAYLEGKLSSEELNTFKKFMDSDPELSNMVDDIRTLELDMDVSINEDYPDFMESFELPLVADIDPSDNLEVLDYDIEVAVDERSLVPHSADNNPDDIIQDSGIDTLGDSYPVSDMDNGSYVGDFSNGID